MSRRSASGCLGWSTGRSGRRLRRDAVFPGGPPPSGPPRGGPAGPNGMHLARCCLQRAAGIVNTVEVAAQSLEGNPLQFDLARGAHVRASQQGNGRTPARTARLEQEGGDQRRKREPEAAAGHSGTTPGKAGAEALVSSKSANSIRDRAGRAAGRSRRARSCDRAARPCAPDQRTVRKKARISSASSSGCSSAGKCPPRSIVVQRVMFPYMRSASDRGGRRNSLGNSA